METATETTTPVEPNRQIERDSYSLTSYRRVMRIREKGAEYGIKVPYLQYPLPPRQKAGPGLKTMTIITGVMIGVAAALLIFALSTMVFPLMAKSGLGGTSTDLVNTTKDIPVLNLISGSIVLMIWLVIILVPLLAGIALTAGILYLVNLIRISHASIPEKAVGFQLRKMKTWALVLTIALFAGAIASFVFTALKGFPWLVGVVCLVVMAYTAALYAVLKIEQSNAKVEFAKLPEAQQADFIAHNNGLRAADNRRQSQRDSRRASRSMMSGKSKLGLLFAILEMYADGGIAYHNLKESEFRATTTTLGWRALGYLAYFAVGGAAGVGLMWWVFHGLGGVGMAIAIVFAIMAGIYIFAIAFPLALNLSIKQLKLNKKPIGWISLLGTLAMLVVLIAGAVMITNL